MFLHETVVETTAFRNGVQLKMFILLGRIPNLYVSNHSSVCLLEKIARCRWIFYSIVVIIYFSTLEMLSNSLFSVNDKPLMYSWIV
jgi:hypothetical protein